ncbi:hypothetical protein C8J57DRAFT_1494911 [Mycena rebaudengoi]|nr:hypothetical protein C8J57DRAFT_1494911 [Mycena rebaudengoi]
MVRWRAAAAHHPADSALRRTPPSYRPLHVHAHGIAGVACVPGRISGMQRKEPPFFSFSFASSSILPPRFVEPERTGVQRQALRALRPAAYAPTKSQMGQMLAARSRVALQPTSPGPALSHHAINRRGRRVRLVHDCARLARGSSRRAPRA